MTAKNAQDRHEEMMSELRVSYQKLDSIKVKVDSVEDKVDNVEVSISNIKTELATRQHYDEKVKELDKWVNGNGHLGAKSQIGIIYFLNVTLTIALIINIFTR